MTSFTATGNDVRRALITTSDDAYVKDIKFSAPHSSRTAGPMMTVLLNGVDCSKLKPSKKTGSLQPCVDYYDIEFAFDGKRSSVTPTNRATFNRVNKN